MVVLGVTAMLSSLILVYNSSTRETLALFTEKARIAQLILRSKSLALSTYAERETPCGYGVRFERGERRYALVAYRPAECTDRSRVDIDPEAYEVVQLSTFELPPSLEYGTRASETAEGAEDVSYILFIPPDPLVLVAREDGSIVGNGLGQVELKVRNRPTSAIVTINAAGQITF